jgi:uncharacterized membrane protein HdeD (DUF308 family)
MPDVSLVVLTLMFGWFAFFDGIAAVWNAISSRKDDDSWWVLLLIGLAGIGIGIVTFKDPSVTALSLQFYIAIWAIATGLLELVAAMSLRKVVQGEFWLGLAGLLSIAFGWVLIARPSVGAMAVLSLIGGYAIVFGMTLIILAFRARGFVDRVVDAVKA